LWIILCFENFLNLNTHTHTQREREREGGEGEGERGGEREKYLVFNCDYNYMVIKIM